MQIFLNAISVLLLTTVVVLLVIGLIEPYLLKIERVNWNRKSDDKTNVTGQNDFETGISRLRLILLSDLHTEFIFVNRDRVLRAIEQAKPDLIIFSGDWTGPKRQGALKRANKWQKGLSDIAARQQIRLIAVPGNHDDETVRSVLNRADSGIDLLINEAVTIEATDHSLWQIIGLDDLKYGQPQLPDLWDIPPDRTIITAHNPDTMLIIPEGAGDYFLSGHFHGGQIWAPGKLEFKLFRREQIASEGFYRGEFEYNGRKCYISRGLGCVVMPLRLFSKPELTIIEIKTDSAV